MRTTPKLVARLVLSLPACSSAPSPAPMGTAPSSMGPQESPPPLAAAEEASRGLPRGPIDETALVEGERSGGPFRAVAPPPAPPPEDIRPRKSRHFAVDQLQLVG